MDRVADILLDRVSSSPPFRELLSAVESGDRISVGGMPGSLSSVVIAATAREKPVVVVTSNSASGEALLDDLYTFIGEDEACFLPPRGDGKLRRMTRETAAHHRAESLSKLANSPPKCLVVLPGTLLERYPSRRGLQNTLLNLKKGKEINPHSLLKRLMNCGFKREVQVEGSGEVALRGGILDIFAFGRRNPIRIEFWGDEIVSLREFDHRSQRSIRELDNVDLFINSKLQEDNNIFELHKGVIFWDGIEQIEEHYQRLAEVDISPMYLVPEGRASVVMNPLARMGINFGGSGAEMFLGSEIDFLARAEKHFRNEYSVIFGAESDYRRQRIVGSLREVDEEVAIRLETGVVPLQRGFIYPPGKLAFYTERELYDRPRPRRSFAKFRTYAHPVDPDSLRKGDFVVHIDYGIGIFQGLKTIKAAGSERECIHIKYRDDVSLYIPLESFSKVQKYSGREGFVPALSKIGGRDWVRMRKRTKKALLEMAKDLIQIQAKREVKGGFAFAEDDIWQRELEDSFLYEDTPDQKRVTEEVKRDMERSRPMDRLLLGDVGFGKTEVAVRAAFKAIQSNKQVAVLAPTTILVQQHLQTFIDRMSSYPVKIESLSRFKSISEQRKVLQGLRSGSVDVVIGTHRILSKDVSFRRLGLVIIDEEHRFGVRHKEKLKKLREEVDVLTLTATPIPRTLHLALGGMRDLSRIETPPADRLPIITEIVPFDKGVIREAVMNEIRRGGQVFFVHNRVRSINALKSMLYRIVPEARFAVAHGQMKPRELEQVMLEFIRKEVDCLVCTMIVESGIDLPNVNTMIVNRADKMGLAQLYQLRGRIGRSDRQAYAYLLIPPKLSLTEQARLRLETIAQYTELGAGFQVALKDLEIRGAGNLLGSQQSGFINSIGFDMYAKLLEEAINEVRREHRLETDEPRREAAEAMKDGINFSFSGDAYIPADYIEDENLRVNFYRRMSRYGTTEELKKLEVEMVDRFGPLPEPLINLLGTLKLRILAADKKIVGLEIDEEAMKFDVLSRDEGYKELIVNAVKAAGDYQIEFRSHPAFSIILRGSSGNGIKGQLEAAQRFLNNLV